MKNGAPDTLHVVVERTPDQGAERPAPERVRAQRRAAREALARAAALARCPDQAFEKSSERGRPVPTAGGWHWTISHDATFVAAAVWRAAPVGVDLERIALRRRLLVERVADAEERAVLGESDAAELDAFGFARLWTTKEAVLKAERIGLPGLEECRVLATPSPHVTLAAYRGEARSVAHARIAATHLVSVCVLGAAPRAIVWHVAG